MEREARGRERERERRTKLLTIGRKKRRIVPSPAAGRRAPRGALLSLDLLTEECVSSIRGIEEFAAYLSWASS